MTRAASWPRPRYAWYVVALLLLAYAFGVVDRNIVGLLLPYIKADLELTDLELGLLQGPAFGVFFALAALPIGLLVDRWRRVPVLWGGLLVWSLATMASGLVATFVGLFLARMLVGAGEATTTPASASTIADTFPPAQRPKAFGIYQAGGAVGQGMGYLLSAFALLVVADIQALWPAWFGELRNWQIVFLTVGFPGVLLALLMMITMREPGRFGAALQTPQITLRPLLDEVRANWTALTVVIVATVMNVLIVNAKVAWFPSLFMRVHDWRPEQVGYALAAVGMPLGLFSCLTAGWSLAWLEKRGSRDGPMLVMLLQCGAWMIFGPLQSLAPSPFVTLIFHGCTALFATWCVTAAFTALSRITPNRLRGQVMAIYSVIFAFVGVSLGPPIVGWLNDRVFTGAQGIAYSLAIVTGVVGLIGVLVSWWGRGAYIRAVERAERAG
ncbi:MAG: MFS transporter [Steroidobacteraceae bacterium]|nr:MFS transporter [Steroidobacteraceae bacterium]MDW8259677.1 MFS transporter [Gammaproteobacteria bacterium]